jgi:hypothetical protein
VGRHQHVQRTEPDLLRRSAVKRERIIIDAGLQVPPRQLLDRHGRCQSGHAAVFPTSPTYSGTAYVEVLLDSTQSVEERPDKFKGVRGLKVANYNSSGTVNGFRQLLHQPGPSRADLLKRAGLLSRIDWTSWVTWRDYCAASIAWGAGNITRFECHAAFTAGIDIVTVLVGRPPDGLHLPAGRWAKSSLPVLDNAVIDPNTTAPVHTFTVSNARNVSVINNDRRQLPTGYTATFRDVDDGVYDRGIG